MKKFLCLLLVLIFGTFTFLPSCKGPKEGVATKRIRVATTTSVEDSGLLDQLLPPFEKKFNVKVDVIAVGTGKALRLGENGDVDLVFIHNREEEERFIREGFGINRREVMHNYFVIVGPKEDPAKIEGMGATNAFRKIAGENRPFVSRGDDSGTHKREKKLWNLAGITPKGNWYLETGQGMGATLQIADEKKAYSLVDRGTYIASKERVSLVILSQTEKNLFNPYSIIAVSPRRYPQANYLYAMALIGWVTSQEGQRIIKGYQRGGKVLFYPSAY